VLFELQLLDRDRMEAARDRGISVGAVKSLQDRALEQLREMEADAA
jgi:DNA-directed RNA polymerase specialized sigma24 family protein